VRFSDPVLLPLSHQIKEPTCVPPKASGLLLAAYCVGARYLGTDDDDDGIGRPGVVKTSRRRRDRGAQRAAVAEEEGKKFGRTKGWREKEFMR
jgi:hypothetical protein